jgi:hypothetical protein
MKKRIIMRLAIAMGLLLVLCVASVSWSIFATGVLPRPLRNIACVYSARYANYEKKMAKHQAGSFEDQIRIDPRFSAIRLWDAENYTEVPYNGGRRLTERVIVIRLQGGVENPEDLNALRDKVDHYGFTFPIDFSPEVKNREKKGSNN